jgi:CubicO group peptidase (beta-lactamase class C family)
MMKKVLAWIIVPFFLHGQASAQSIDTQFNTIASNNDMMGGSLVIFCADGIIENLTVGLADYERNISITADTKYRIASISKTITAIAAMQLVEQNLLQLDSAIGNVLGYDIYNPHYPSKPITARMLLSHTSSIIDGPTYGDFLAATINDNPIPDISELLTEEGVYYASEQFNNTEPGTYFNYANINYVLLGTIVEKISGMRFDTYCKQYITSPLGIDASFNVNDLADINQLAVLYRKVGSTWTPQADNYEGVQPVFDNIDGYIPGTNGGRFGPQGGFRCSAQDLAHIFLVLMHKGTYNDVTLLSEASCHAMFENVWTYDGSNGNNYYGLFRSWGLGIHRITSTAGGDIVLPDSDAMLGHAGEAYGLVSNAYFDTTRNVGFVFITNGVGDGYHSNSYSAFYTIEQQIFEAIETHGNISVCSVTDDIHINSETPKHLYPVPAGDFLHLPDQCMQEPCTISILSLEGKLLKKIELLQGVAKIDIRDLKAGEYIIIINNTTATFIKYE